MNFGIIEENEWKIERWKNGKEEGGFERLGVGSWKKENMRGLWGVKIEEGWFFIYLLYVYKRKVKRWVLWNMIKILKASIWY